MRKTFIYIVLLFASAFYTYKLQAQETPETTENSEAPAPRRSAAAKPKPYKSVVTADAVTTKGFFKVHRVKDRYLFELPVNMIGRDILVSSRISDAALRTSSLGERSTLYAGDAISQGMIAFSKGPKDNIFIEEKMVMEKATDSTNGVARALKKNGLQPLLASFDIKAYTTDSSAVVIDMTDFIAGDNDVFYFGKNGKAAAGGLTTLESNKSYIEGVKTFPINIEIATVKTYKTAGSAFLTYGLNTSLVLLPEKPMKPRYVDQRVGYFGNGIIDFDEDYKSAGVNAMVARWRLEPKPEDMEKYKRGELVEPAKPIIIYVDPATPKKWVPYLIAGVNDWQQAFEQAGFKNAIMAKEAPTDDPNWSLENALYSAFVYKPSRVANASGPHLSDPRSGEIIETHINWYHNVMDLIYRWYFIQCANVDPRARAAQFDDELMGQLIRFVSSHEVGHTLGLKHNFGSSSTVPVELLRNKAWVEANGHTPSIMDYARFNYVAQPKDNISYKGLFPRIGAYDKWAIQWGYKLIPDAKTPESETAILNQWIIDSLKANPFLFYGAQGLRDPRSQSEVLGDDPMIANDYGITNLKAILPNIIEWTKVPGEYYTNIREIRKALSDQYYRYMNHVLFYVVGKYITYESSENPVVTFVPKEKVKEALVFLNKHFFTTPAWLLYDPKQISYYGSLPSDHIGFQETTISAVLLSDGVQELFSDRSFYNMGGYTLDEYVSDLDKYILSDILSGKALPDYYRRILQRIYVESLAKKIIPNAQIISRSGPVVLKINANPDISSDGTFIFKEHIKKLSAQFKKAIAASTNKEAKDHLVYLNEILDHAIKASKEPSKIEN